MTSKCYLKQLQVERLFLEPELWLTAPHPPLGPTVRFKLALQCTCMPPPPAPSPADGGGWLFGVVWAARAGAITPCRKVARALCRSTCRRTHTYGCGERGPNKQSEYRQVCSLYKQSEVVRCAARINRVRGEAAAAPPGTQGGS